MEDVTGIQLRHPNAGVAEFIDTDKVEVIDDKTWIIKGENNNE